MHRRHQSTNIPTEIIRTIVMIAEAGSFSKVGQGLGLSQSAISAQVKRLQYMVGGPIFQRITGGVSFTAKGKIILTQARRILKPMTKSSTLAVPQTSGELFAWASPQSISNNF